VTAQVQSAGRQEALEAAREYLYLLAEKLEALADRIRFGFGGQAGAPLGPYLEELGTAADLMATQGKAAEQLVLAYHEVLSRMLEAWQTGDRVALADAVAYDLVPLLRELADRLSLSSEH
jgi:hypothetical protein